MGNATYDRRRADPWGNALPDDARHWTDEQVGAALYDATRRHPVGRLPARPARALLADLVRLGTPLPLVMRASVWLESLRVRVATWTPPHVSYGDGESLVGEVALEWWRDPRKLTVYVSATAITYLASWGADPVAEMADGDASSPRAARALWAWLHGAAHALPAALGVTDV